MKKLLERYPFFLVLLPAFVTIHLEKELHQVISYRFVYDRIIIFFIVPIILFSLFYLLNRSLKKSAFLSFILAIPFFYTGDLKNWLSLKFPESIWQSYSFLLTFLLVVSATFCYIIQRSKSDFRKQFLVMNTGLFLFISADIVSIAFKITTNKYNLAVETEVNLQPCNDCEKPDIYYIVFDTYASTKILQSKFNYSNAFIDEYLTNKGFYDMADWKSNYSYTSFSIGSTLNMNYIRNVDTSKKTYDRDYLQSLKLVNNNHLVNYLENEGYSIYNHSLFDLKSNPSTIKYFDNWGFIELFDQYNIFSKLKQDISYRLPEWFQKIIWNSKYSITDPSNRMALDSTVKSHLSESINSIEEKPKFVYAHFLKPHPPYSHDSLGVSFNDSLLSIEEIYIHQIAYCNRIIKVVTDSILASAKKPLVIIIQGDHGTPITNESERHKLLNNFNSIYFSNGDYSLFNDSLSNVNTFRIVLNTFFKQKLPLLPNEFYVFKN